MPILLSDGPPDAYRLGDVPLDSAYLGDDKLWPLFTAQGMSKAGTQSMGANAFTRVTGWAADAGSTVTGDALVVAGAGACTISTAVVWTVSGANRQCRVTRNGTVVWTSASVGSGTTAAGSFSLTVAAGDVLALEAFTTSTLASNRIVAATSTFLRLVPA